MKRSFAAALLLTTFLFAGLSFADSIDDDPAVSLAAGTGVSAITINSNADWPANPVPVATLPNAQQYVTGASFTITSLLISATPLPTTDFSKYSCNTAFGMSCVITLDTANNIIYFYMSGGSISTSINQGRFALSAQSSAGLAWSDHEAFTVKANVPNVPEPASLMLFGSGLAALSGVMRRKFRK